jgi:hypothetical protein
MKYLLSLTLILLPHILNNKVIIDLENQNREGSDYIRHLKWIQNKEITQTLYGPEYIFQKETNETIKLDLRVGLTSTQSLSTQIPTLTITSVEQQVQFDYKLDYKLSQECLLFNQPEKAKGDIQCTYRNARYTTLTKTFINKNYKKELPIARRFVVGLTQNGDFEVGIVNDNQLLYDYDYNMKSRIKYDFKSFDGKVIKDFFVGEEKVNISILSILTEDELIIFKYKAFDGKNIDFEKLNTFDLKKLNIKLTNLKQVFYTEKQCFLFLKNGFYMLKSSSGSWDFRFISKLSTKDSEVELSDIEANFNESYICISIKGYGFIIVDGELRFLHEFKHKYVNQIVTSKHTKGIFNIGVSIDNQSNKDVKEFFAELALVGSAESSELLLSRVFISSNKVKAVHTDTQGLVVMFLIGTNAYIAPRSIYSTNTLPVYIYRDAYHTAVIGFINIETESGQNFIMFRISKPDEEENEVITLYTTDEENENFHCNFKSAGKYLAKVTKQYLNYNNEPANQTTTFHINLGQKEADENKDKANGDTDAIKEDKKDSESRKDVENDKGEDDESDKDNTDKKDDISKNENDEAADNIIHDDKDKKHKNENDEAADDIIHDNGAKNDKNKNDGKTKDNKEGKQSRQTKDNDKAKEDSGKEIVDDKKPTTEEEQGTGFFSNTVMIVIIAAASAVVLIGVIISILYIRKKRRQYSSGTLLEAGNYPIETQTL